MEEIKVEGIIYRITNLINEKKYIGQTRTHYRVKDKYRKTGMKFRFDQHYTSSMREDQSRECRVLSYAFRKYGRDGFKVEEIMKCSIEDLDKYEDYYIRKENTILPNGYNMKFGGQGRTEWSDELREKMSKTRIELFKDPVIRKQYSDTSRKYSNRKRMEALNGRVPILIKLKVIRKDGVNKNINLIFQFADKTTKNFTFYGDYIPFEDVYKNATDWIKKEFKNIPLDISQKIDNSIKDEDIISNIRSYERCKKGNVELIHVSTVDSSRDGKCATLSIKTSNEKKMFKVGFKTVKGFDESLKKAYKFIDQVKNKNTEIVLSDKLN